MRMVVIFKKKSDAIEKMDTATINEILGFDFRGVICLRDGGVIEYVGANRNGYYKIIT